MTIRDAINGDLARIRREQLLAAILFFPSFVMLAYFQYHGIELIRLPASMLLVSLVLMIHAFSRVQRRIRCRACGKSLGHIMFNAHLTRNNYAALLCPVQFPATVTQCPHCDALLDGEPEQAHDVDP